MATETLYATSHITGTFVNPNNALGVADGVWAGQVNVADSPTSRWAMGDTAGNLTQYATQTIEVVARKGSNSGNPTVALNLYENGSLVQSILAATVVTSTTGQTLTGTFSTSAITNPANVEIEVVVSGVSGGGGTRNSAQIDSIKWLAETGGPSPHPQTYVGDPNSPSWIFSARFGTPGHSSYGLCYNPATNKVYTVFDDATTGQRLVSVDAVTNAVVTVWDTEDVEFVATTPTSNNEVIFATRDPVTSDTNIYKLDSSETATFIKNVPYFPNSGTISNGFRGISVTHQDNIAYVVDEPITGASRRGRLYIIDLAGTDLENREHGDILYSRGHEPYFRSDGTYFHTNYDYQQATSINIALRSAGGTILRRVYSGSGGRDWGEILLDDRFMDWKSTSPTQTITSRGFVESYDIEFWVGNPWSPAPDTNAVAFTEDRINRRLWVSYVETEVAASDRGNNIWYLDFPPYTPPTITCPCDLPSLTPGPQEIAISPDGATIYRGKNADPIEVWSVPDMTLTGTIALPTTFSTGQSMWTSPAGYSAVYGVTVDADGILYVAISKSLANSSETPDYQYNDEVWKWDGASWSLALYVDDYYSNSPPPAASYESISANGIFYDAYFDHVLIPTQTDSGGVNGVLRVRDAKTGTLLISDSHGGAVGANWGYTHLVPHPVDGGIWHTITPSGGHKLRRRSGWGSYIDIDFDTAPIGASISEGRVIPTGDGYVLAYGKATGSADPNELWMISRSGELTSLDALGCGAAFRNVVYTPTLSRVISTYYQGSGLSDIWKDWAGSCDPSGCDGCGPFVGYIGVGDDCC